jgi:hypothetical protein
LPIAYAVDPDRHLELLVLTGDITARALKSFWKKHRKGPQGLAIRRALVDVRACDLRFTGRELSDFLDTVAVPAVAGRQVRIAILVDTPVQYGVAHQFQVLAGLRSETEIFDEHDKALDWILAESSASALRVGT